MDKKQIALGIVIASFCAATMTSCGGSVDLYGSPERYHEYNEESNQVNDNKNNKSDANQDNSNKTNQESNNKAVEKNEQ